jgi:hypothetical protein
VRRPGTVSLAPALLAVVWVASAAGGNALSVKATDLGGNVLLVGRFHVSNPSYCLAKKPSYSAPNYGDWVSKRCAPYTVQHADFEVVVRYGGREVFTDAFPIDGAYGDPSRGGTFTPYYLYCGLMSNHRVTGRPGVYAWTLTMADPFRRPGYDISQHGMFSCRKKPGAAHPVRPRKGPGLT